MELSITFSFYNETKPKSQWRNRPGNKKSMEN